MTPQFGINPRDGGLQPIDFEQIFGNRNPVIVEIGSGKGRFLISHAREHPELNVVGIEKSLHYYRVILRRLEKAGLANARIINYDAFAILQQIPDRAVRELHIYFPDPWPRKREQKRRIIRADACEQFRRVLEHDGFGLYVTDHFDYFERAREELAEYFVVEAGEVATGTPPRTNYEAKYRAEGRPIYEVRFRKRQ